MQKTNFTFEVLIHDDASTDGTTEIVREYAKKFPKIIKPIYEKENQYSKPSFEFIKDMYVDAVGKYIATCEGDDYWTDELKLQKQVDYMNANPGCTLSFHLTSVVFENNEEPESVFPVKKEGMVFDLVRLMRANYIQTSSVMYRRRRSYKDMYADAMPGDWYTHLYHVREGEIGFIDEVMSVYRRHKGGVWWGSHAKADDFWVKFAKKHVETYSEVRKIYSGEPELEAQTFWATVDIYNSVLEMKDTSSAYRIISECYADYPEMMSGAYGVYKEQAEQGKVDAEKLSADVNKLHADIREKDEYIHRLEKQLREIHQTRTWRVKSKIDQYKEKISGKK